MDSFEVSKWVGGARMKIQLLSDLHLEQNVEFVPEPAPHADVLVLAGDIGSYRAGSHLSGLDDSYGLQRFSPKPEFAGWPVPVFYVPGNHEYDGQDFDSVHQSLRRICERLGIIWLERESVVMGGVRFAGTTLWSDFEAMVPPRGEATREEQQQAYETALRTADRYLNFAATWRRGKPWLAAQIRDQALECRHWLRGVLTEPFDGATVVVTHFAPSLRSADPRYGVTPATAGFCNAMDDWLQLADLWLHGHLHCKVEYRAGHCRVLSNPLGFMEKDEQQSFDPLFVVETGESSVKPQLLAQGSPASEGDHDESVARGGWQRVHPKDGDVSDHAPGISGGRARH